MLRDYGMNLGIAFQLIDLLDFTSTEDVLEAARTIWSKAKSRCLILLLQRQPELSAIRNHQRVVIKASRQTLLDALRNGSALDLLGPALINMPRLPLH
jgi:geranylgeranyl pyrophosphate synthase